MKFLLLNIFLDLCQCVRREWFHEKTHDSVRGRFIHFS